MSTLNTYISLALGLVLVYLLVLNAQGTNTVIGALSQANNSALRTLQGR